MKSNTRYFSKLSVLLFIACFVLGPHWSSAARRHHAARPHGHGGGGGYGGYGAPGRGGPGVGAPGRGAPGRGAPGVGAPGPGYVHARPAAYERRAYNNLNYYYWDDTYYYEYTNDGPPLYVEATLVNGVPTVPMRPYIYTLPGGFTIRTFGNAKYYYYPGNPGFYYHGYYINGRSVYVLATVTNGQPAIPPQPY